jgi:hypothetical protein
MINLKNFLIYLKIIKKFTHDRLQLIYRITAAKNFDIPHLSLRALQVYPHGRNFINHIEESVLINFKNISINKVTATASIGTCFAEEFSNWIMASSGNYLYEEPNVFSSSANWGRVYTIPNLYQVIQYSTNKEFPYFIEHCKNGYFDCLRERSIGYFNSYELALASIKAHRTASEKVFRNAEVLVITLGQNEAWIDKDRNIIYGSMPPADLLIQFPDRFLPIEFSYSDNCEKLIAAIKILNEINHSIKLIITVSPVAAHATFLSDDVVTQSFAGKCMLRSVVHEVVDKDAPNVLYFPSFEIVFCDNSNKFRADNRHVKYGTVRDIFSILNKAVTK